MSQISAHPRELNRSCLKDYSLTSSRNSSLSFFIYASLIQYFGDTLFDTLFKIAGQNYAGYEARERGKIASFNSNTIVFNSNTIVLNSNTIDFLFSNEKLASFNSNTIVVQFEHHSHQTMLNALTWRI